MITAASRLRKHADFQRVYAKSRKQFSKQMSYFFALRELNAEAASDTVPRVGLTVGRVMGGAVQRNRIKRRMREAVRRNLALLTQPVDVVLHPRKSVLTLEFAELERDVQQVFRGIETAASKKQREAR